MSGHRATNKDVSHETGQDRKRDRPMVLVVDDEDSMRESFGREALRRALRSSVDLEKPAYRRFAP
jgi:hypothetical protein